jgi:probable HAF family extracellular repeat protein
MSLMVICLGATGAGAGGCGRTRLDEPVDVVAVADAGLGADGSRRGREDAGADATDASSGSDAGERARFVWIPAVRSDFYWPAAISRNGKVVVGYHGSATNYRPFRWTAESGVADLPIAGVRSSDTDLRALGTNSDGSVVAGVSQSPAQIGTFARAFRWTAQTGTEDLGPSPTGGGILASAVSADGAVLVGTFNNADSQDAQAFRWTAATGIMPIGGQYAWGVDEDGSVVVGTSGYSGSDMPFRWTAATGAVPFGTVHKKGTAVNADGSVIVGSSDYGEDWHAFRWTDAAGIVELGEVTGFVISAATGVSADGSVVVGSVSGPPGLLAAVWTSDGPHRIDAVLQAAGADTAGAALDAPAGVSDDGTVTAGSGRDANGVAGFWVARLP